VKEMKNKGTIFYLMIVSMLIRLFWLVGFEPHGAKRAAAKTQQMGELAQFASTIIPFVVYPSIIILISIIIYSLMRKRWAYLAGSIFGLVHFALISILVIMHVSPGRGFLVVILSSLGMMVFSFLCYRKD
jgi:hypothetical protein